MCWLGFRTRTLLRPLASQLAAEKSQVSQLINGGVNSSQFSGLSSTIATGATQLLAENFFDLSDSLTAELEKSYEVLGYFGSPRLVVSSLIAQYSASTGTIQVESSIDLLSESMRTVAFPGQSTNAPFNFNVSRGLGEDSSEYIAAASISPQGTAVSAGRVFGAASQQGILLEWLSGSSGIAELKSSALTPLRRRVSPRCSTPVKWYWCRSHL